MDKLFLKEFAYQYITLHDNLTRDEKLYVGNFVKEASDEQVMALLLSGECREKLAEGEGKYVKLLFEASPAADIITKGSEFIGKVGKAGITGQSPSTGWIKKLASMWANYKVGPGTTANFSGFKVTHHADFGAWTGAYDKATSAIQQGTPVAALVMAALITLVATKLYKSYISKAARNCKGQATSVLKKACIKKFAVTALERKLQMLRTSIKACDATKKPETCKKVVIRKIQKTQNKLAKMKT